MRSDPVPEKTLARSCGILPTLACVGANLLLVTTASSANEDAVKTKPCKPAVQSTHTIVRQTGPASLELDDASEVVLAGLVLPSQLDNNTAVAKWAPELAARDQVRRLAVDASVGVAPTTPFRDRYGRLRAHLFVHHNREPVWLQALLLGLGHARVSPEELQSSCAALLLRIEAQARQARQGIWRQAAYRIRNATRPWSLLRHRSSFQIVEGTVRKVARVRSRTFINFGTNWRVDFTAGLKGKLAKTAKIDGRPITELTGRRVRIRGWIRRRGGPYISVRSLSQIELMPDRKIATDQNSTNVRPTGPQTRKRPANREPGVIDL